MLLYKVLRKITELYYYFLMRRIHKNYNIQKNKVTLNNHEFYMSFPGSNLSDRIIDRLNGRHEPETILMLDLLVKPDETILELGACYGFFTIQLAKLVGAKGTVYSYEPMKSHYDILARNVEDNMLVNVKSKMTLVTGYEKEYYQDPADNSFMLTEDYKAGYIKVPCQSISDLCDELKTNIDWLFMDIEGSEVEIIESIVENNLNITGIIFETHQKRYSIGKDLNYIIRILRTGGFQITHSDRMILARKSTLPGGINNAS